VLDPDARAIALPDGGLLDLRRRASLRLILLALVRWRLGAPGQPLGPDELVAAGWPGQRVLPHAASNRLHVAIATLRSLGLRGALLRERRGYLLDPRINVEFAQAS
jgi:hypothetical protein